MRTLGLWAAIVLGPILLCQADSVRIRVDNQTYDTIFLSRIGDPNTAVLVPKRMMGDFPVPLVDDHSPTLEILLVRFSSSITVPETEFKGFNGRYGQPVSLIVKSPQDISVTYDPTQTSVGSNSTNSGDARSYGGTYYGGEGGPPISQGAKAPSLSSNTSRLPQDNESTTPPKRIIVAGNTGARIKIPDSRTAAIEAPAPIRGKIEIPKAPPASPIYSPAGERKGNYRALITWIAVCTALAGFIIWKRFSSR
jgi:hypothetical protein